MYIQKILPKYLPRAIRPSELGGCVKTSSRTPIHELITSSQPDTWAHTQLATPIHGLITSLKPYTRGIK